MALDKLKIIKDLPNDKVEVEDSEGLRWIVGRTAYNKFKRTGFLHVAKDVAQEFQHILNGRSFGDMSDPEKYEVIVNIIEAATQEPIALSLPNLARVNDSN